MTHQLNCQLVTNSVAVCDRCRTNAGHRSTGPQHTSNQAAGMAFDAALSGEQASRARLRLVSSFASADPFLDAVKLSIKK